MALYFFLNNESLFESLIEKNIRMLYNTFSDFKGVNLMIKGIAHLAFQVSNMPASVKFYEEALGFKQKFTLYDQKNKPWIVYLQLRKDQFIELFFAHEPIVSKSNSSSYQHLCLEVEDIHTVTEEIVRKGYELDQPIIMGLDNNYQCWVHDPDGNPIELMEYGEGSLQLK